MNYTTLVGLVSDVGSIKYWINYTRIDSAGTEAEAWIYARLRVQEMLATDDVAIALNGTSAAFPTGYMDPIHFGIPGWQPLIKFVDPERFRAGLGWDQSAVLPVNMPSRWTRLDGQIALNSKADRAYTAKMAFYKRPTALGAD